MIKNVKEKVFELKIDENDDLSGIDSISLVDTPAIEVNWMYFKKQEEHEFHIPDNEDDLYISKLIEKAQDEQELLNDGWVIDKIILKGQDNFYSTSPNAPSIEDETEYLVRYKYILKPGIAQRPVISTTRDFCKTLINKNFVWRIEDMESTTNDFGDSALVWRGGFNCRHVWARIEYRKGADIINKGSVTKGRIDTGGIDTRVLGYDQPSTVTSATLANPSPSTVRNLGLSKQFEFADKPKISLDYDGVLSTDKGKELYKELVDGGNDVYIVTKRNEKEGQEVLQVAKELRIPQIKVLFTNGGDKSEVLKRIGITKHYDNNQDVLDEITKNAPEVEAIKFGYDVGSIGGYVDPSLTGDTISKSILGSVVVCEKCGWEWNMSDGGINPYVCHKCGHDNSFNKSMFESHSDYPDSVKNNAKAVLEYVDVNGWGGCGTDVGKQRANQLAKGEPISEETIRRMYSYLSRHEGDLDSSKGYGDGCGKLMYDSWGGKTALNWAKSKINTFDKQKMSKQYFQIDNEEKRIVIGPAMIPHQKIFRKDEEGNPYYVFFSPETIRMIAEKYMKNQYTRNNDLMHNGKAVKDVYVTESWIKESMEDKSNKYGYGELPIGSWFVSMKIPKTPMGEKVWQQVKNGELNGFSVSGYFSEEAKFKREEMFLQRLAELLREN